MMPWAHPSPQPKWHFDQFSRLCTVCRDDCRVTLYLAMRCPFPPLKLPLPMKGSGSHLIHNSLGSPESSTQMVSPLVLPFLQGWLVWQTNRLTDRQTDHTTQSATIGHIYVQSTVMWPINNNSICIAPMGPNYKDTETMTSDTCAVWQAKREQMSSNVVWIQECYGIVKFQQVEN